MTSTRGGETLRMADSQAKEVMSSCAIVPTLTGDFFSGVEWNGRLRLQRAEIRGEIRIGSRTVLNVTC